MITDSHAHVFWDSFESDREDVLARARAAGVERMVIVGTNPETSRAAFELCRGRSGLFPTAGIHPHDCSECWPQQRGLIDALARLPECVAIGETGLDFFKEFSPRALQLESFHWHLELARELGKPVVVHSRDAHEATVEALRAHAGVRGVMHCYTLGEDELAPYLEAGFYISFSGVVTYPRNEHNRAAARAVPLERLLVETDCPYLAPQGSRGRRNEPALVREVVACVARARGLSEEEVARATHANAARLFGLPAS